MDLSPFNGRYHRASEPSPGVLLLEFNRAPVNAFHDDMWIELRSIVERISDSPQVRVVVLSSALDKYSTAGLDLTSQSNLNDATNIDVARKALVLRHHIIVRPFTTTLGPREETLMVEQDFQNAITSLAACRQPVIAAIFGITFGLGIDLASACDIRLAASNTVFAIAEVNVGLAADIGSLQRLPKIVGNDAMARELALTGRRFDAAEAKEMGLIGRVIDGGRNKVIAAAVEMGKVIAQKSPVAVIGTKHLMNHARDHTVEEGLEYTATWNMAMLQSADTTTAMKAALAKQTPVYPPISAPKPDRTKGKL